MELVRAGRALLLRETPDAKPHLWFVLTDPDGIQPRVVAVMVRSARHFTDPTVVLTVGDHPFVRHESSVHYSSARRFTVQALQKAFGHGHCSLQADMSPTLLARVREGLMRSPFTVNVIREYCRDRFGG
jgi:hypothetical protein